MIPIWPIILDEPECDLHRLLFADHIEEMGEADRAAFIRVQVELEPARRMGAIMAPPQSALLSRERELLQSIAVCEWFTAPGLAVSWSSTGFHGWIHKPRGGNSRGFPATLGRGFVKSFSCERVDLPHLPSILASQPIERITCEGVEFAIELGQNLVGEWRWGTVDEGARPHHGTRPKAWIDRKAMCDNLHHFIAESFTRREQLERYEREEQYRREYLEQERQRRIEERRARRTTQTILPVE